MHSLECLVEFLVSLQPHSRTFTENLIRDSSSLLLLAFSVKQLVFAYLFKYILKHHLCWFRTSTLCMWLERQNKIKCYCWCFYLHPPPPSSDFPTHLCAISLPTVHIPCCVLSCGGSCFVSKLSTFVHLTPCTFCCPNGNFSHGKFGLLSPWKPAAIVALPNPN